MAAQEPPTPSQPPRESLPPPNLSTKSYSQDDAEPSSSSPHLRIFYAEPPTMEDSTPVESTVVAAARRIGPYEVVEEIARGGMGVVLKARDPRLNRLVALKMMRGGFLCSTEELLRFKREAKVQASVNHRHILPVLDIGEYEGEQYFTLPYIAGGTLSKRLKDFVNQPAKVVPLMEKISRAVDHAHQKGILHRDLKPTNILLDDEGEPLVSDFGLAKPANASQGITRSHQILGTPQYMAPEQTGHGPDVELSPRTDVWSLGVMLYELLTGLLPFPGKSSTEVFSKVCKTEPPPPRRLRSDLDPRLEKIILRCLEKDPADRYPTAAALADDLARWQRGEAIPSAPLSQRLRRRAKKVPWTLVGGALVILLLAGLCVWLVITANPDTPQVANPQSALPTKSADAWDLFLQRLGKGEKVSLIGATGGPQKWDFSYSRAEVRNAQSHQQPFYCRAEGICRIELLPPGLPPRYRVSFEMRHVPADRGIVGLYFMCHRLQVPQGLSDVYLSLTFGKHESLSAEFKEIYGRKSKHSVYWLFGHVDPIAEEKGNTAGTSWEINRTVPRSQDLDLGDWQRITVEVTPDSVAVFWNGEHRGTYTLKDLEGREQVSANNEPHPKDHDARALTTSGGLGLYLESAGMFVRNMVVEAILQ